jgi:hypothetical protein
MTVIYEKRTHDVKVGEMQLMLTAPWVPHP